MLKFFKFLSISIMMVGCATRDYTMLTKQVADYGLQKIQDKKTNVTCYVYRDADTSSLSCVK
jgi:hypothetical protein